MFNNESLSLNGESTLYLGGYLVCLLVYLRSNTTLNIGLYAEWLREKLKETMAQFFEAEDRASQIRALVKADTILSKIDDLLDNMSPMKYEEFLSPLCSKRDLLFTEIH